MYSLILFGEQTSQHDSCARQTSWTLNIQEHQSAKRLNPWSLKCSSRCSQFSSWALWLWLQPMKDGCHILHCCSAWRGILQTGLNQTNDVMSPVMCRTGNMSGTLLVKTGTATVTCCRRPVSSGLHQNAGHFYLKKEKLNGLIYFL